MDEAERAASRHVKFAEEHGFLAPAIATRVRLGRIHRHRNKRDDFIALVTEGPDYLASLTLTVDSLVRGDVADAARLLPRRDHPDRPMNDPGLLSAQVQVLLGQGEREAAERAFSEWRASIEPQHLIGPADAARAYVTAGEAIVLLGDTPLLEEAYRLLCEFQWLRLASWTEGEAADVVRGMLASRLGDPAAARKHFEEGLAWARRTDVRFGLVEARCHQGLAEVAEREGDHALATQHLDVAGELFAQYGAKLYVDQVIAKKEILKA